MNEPNELSVRDARIDDAPVLAALMTELGAPTTPIAMSRGLNRVLADPAFRTFVAQDLRTNVVGMGGFRVGPSFEGDVLEGEVIVLVVDPHYRGQGVGAALIQAGEAWALERGASSMSLVTRGDAERAQTFYDREGYVEDGLRYRKPLGPAS